MVDTGPEVSRRRETARRRERHCRRPRTASAGALTRALTRPLTGALTGALAAALLSLAAGGAAAQELPREKVLPFALAQQAANAALAACTAQGYQVSVAVVDGAGLLRATLATRATDRLWEASDSEIVDFVDRELARTPVGHLEPQDYAISRTDPMHPIFHPGYLASLIRFGRRIDRSPRLLFAGDYLVGPGLEASITSGLRAAAEAASRGDVGEYSPSRSGTTTHQHPT